MKKKLLGNQYFPGKQFFLPKFMDVERFSFCVVGFETKMKSFFFEKLDFRKSPFRTLTQIAYGELFPQPLRFVSYCYLTLKNSFSEPLSSRESQKTPPSRIHPTVCASSPQRLLYQGCRTREKIK